VAFMILVLQPERHLPRKKLWRSKEFWNSEPLAKLGRT
jgi:hypothetical protein